MLGFSFMKASPTTYVLRYENGKIHQQGLGLSFFYFAPTSSLVAVPVDSGDIPFVFNEFTSDFQPITVQGQITYRISEPREVAGLLDFTIDAHGNYRGDGREVLEQRLVHSAQILTRAVVSQMTMPEALVKSDAIGRQVFGDLEASEPVRRMGVEILSLTVLSIKASPEMARALEAGARESLQREADEAIYARRNAAVEQERIIKENELSTEIAVEEKKRLIRETRMAAEIAVEEQRALLIGHKTENDRKEADTRAYALEATLKPLKDVDWRTLMAASQGAADPKLMIALAFRDLADNAQKIGTLNLSPDLLNSLMSNGKA